MTRRKAWRYRVVWLTLLRERGIALVELLLDLVEDALFVFGERHRPNSLAPLAPARTDWAIIAHGAAGRQRVVRAATTSVYGPVRLVPARLGRAVVARPGPHCWWPRRVSFEAVAGPTRRAGPMAAGAVALADVVDRPAGRASHAAVAAVVEASAARPAARSARTRPRRAAGRPGAGSTRVEQPAGGGGDGGAASTGPRRPVTERVMVVKSP